MVHGDPGAESVFHWTADGKNVDRRGRHENPRQAADDKHRDKGERKEHRRGELDLPSPDRPHPVECLHRAR